MENRVLINELACSETCNKALIPDEVEVVEGPALAVDPEVGEDAEEESR
jgi:hypothetical protein